MDEIFGSSVRVKLTGILSLFDCLANGGRKHLQSCSLISEAARLVPGEESGRVFICSYGVKNSCKISDCGCWRASEESSTTKPAHFINIWLEVGARLHTDVDNAPAAGQAMQQVSPVFLRTLGSQVPMFP